MVGMNKNWQALLTGYGFNVTEEAGVFDSGQLTNHNRDFLNKLLVHLVVEFTLDERKLVINSSEVTEKTWVELLEKYTDGRTESSFAPTEIPLDKLDIYISGVVMQLNRLAYTMHFSCDGHESRRPEIYFESSDFARMAKSVLDYVGVETRRHGRLLKFYTERTMLPTVAVKLSLISHEEAREIFLQNNDLLNVKEFEVGLEIALNIAGASGNEGEIRKYVMEELAPFVDYMMVDQVGNILAEKRFGPGPTVLLNAHLDTYEEIIEDRVLIKYDDIWKSSEGILGADDRAGVNVVLSAAKSVGKSEFNGTVKYIFSVEEEIGLCGAREVTKSFLWGVDMGFVIDRRGTNDIVTSRGGYDPFCSPEFGVRLERIARQSGFGKWKTVSGGSSDTYIWAQSGIESVNLSAGYLFEHTDAEQLDVSACYETYKFLMEILNNTSRLQRRRALVSRVS